VSGSTDGTIRVWHAETGDLAVGPFVGHTSHVTCVALAQDGKRIVSGSYDAMIYIWDASTAAAIAGQLKGHDKWITSLAFLEDGNHFVSASDDHTIRVWDVESGATVSQVGPLEQLVGPMKFSPDGKRLVSVSGSDHTKMLVWDVGKGEVLLGPMEGYSDNFNSVAFSHDGMHIVTGTSDMITRVWDAKTGELVLGPLTGHFSDINSVAFSHDGKYIASASRDNMIRVWSIETEDVVSGPLETNGSPSNAKTPSNDAYNTETSVTSGHGSSRSPFSDSTRLTGGWLLNPPSTLLVWVPSWNRPALCWPRNTVILGGVNTRLNLQNFVHGDSWQQCKK
jgi:WD40 repeat protein